MIQQTAPAQIPAMSDHMNGRKVSPAPTRTVSVSLRSSHETR